jgi:hypothetical protein
MTPDPLRLPAVALWTGAALFAGTTLGYTWTARLVVPYWDEWDFLDFAREAEPEGATFSGLWALNNGHRLFIPRLLFLARDRLLDGDPLALIGLSLLSQAALIALIVTAILRDPRLRGTALSHVLAVAAVVLLTWSVQLENFHWGLQISYVLSAFFAVLAVRLLATAPPERGVRPVLAATASALLSCLCLGAGLAVAPALLAVAAAQRRGLPSFAIIGVGGVLSIALYLGNDLASVAKLLAGPADLAATVTRFLAPPLIDEADRLPIGSALIVFGLASGVVALRTHAGSAAALGLGLMVFGVLASSLIVVARFDEIRFHSRYAAFTSLYWVGLLALVGQATAGRWTTRWALYAALVLLATPVWAIQTRAARAFVDRADGATAAALSLVAGTADDRIIAGQLHPRPDVPRRVLPFLVENRYGFFGGPLVRAIDQPAAEWFETGRDACEASIGLQIRTDGLHLSGSFVGGERPGWLVLVDTAGIVRGLAARERSGPNITGFAPAAVVGGTLFGVQGGRLCRAASLQMAGR